MNRLLKRAAAAALLLSGSGTAQETTVTTTTVSTATTDITTTVASTAASSCATVLTPTYSPPVVAKGWKAQLIATNLSSPRGIKFDSSGGLLVVEAQAGLRRLVFDDNGGTCLSVKESTPVIDDNELNHSLELSADGKTLYVSSTENVDQYSYDAETGTVGSLTRIISNMTNPNFGHSTRTLLLSHHVPDLLVVSRGSSENIDLLTNDITSGISQLRAFNVSNTTTTILDRPYNYPSDGLLIAWGLRNSVGVAEHPEQGTIWSVENSADEIHRLGEDVHEDNPGEELNFHGALNDDNSKLLGANYGYPNCFALWNTTAFPSPGDLAVGAQFSLDNNATANDTACAANTVSPRITFRAHMAPLDIKFNGTSRAFVSFHGSWNRDHPAGYKLSYVDFDNEAGEPVAQSDSLEAVRDVLTAPDVSVCGSGGKCLRPAGLAFDADRQRLFVTSDATGEIWVVTRDGEEVDVGSGEGNASSTSGNGGPSPSSSTAAAVPGVVYRGVGGSSWAVVGVTVGMMVLGGVGFMI
ncbi:soluble quino protein glucose/sorbosone dehydrogenase [Dichotomopilus funicola]|uniref:Soluble quino protein glucose/sorbosone dehydrogenase n=1 Tax=Dichotomopilus funicola TaxID=1934379 RepID=A0AAN6ZNR9_9PEZI|nr:soluble quino protein glucose/sorbosone dehydrogenase [Dichotomopilus funicola]